MKILIINGGNSGSSFSLGYSIAIEAVNKGDTIIFATPLPKPKLLDNRISYYRICGSFERLFNKITARLFDADGFNSKSPTARLISLIRKEKPDIIHIHTLHGYFIDIKLLFKYIKANNFKTIITLHDCWWLTGRCAHYIFNKCEEWKRCCEKCKYKGSYPQTYIVSNSKKHFYDKKKIMEKSTNIHVVAVSDWLKDECIKSPIFDNKEIIRIYNGVDSNTFNIRRKEKNNNTLNMIAVSNVWDKQKGIELIIKLADLLKDKISITIVGSCNEMLPESIKHIEYVSDKREMADMLNQNDVFLNASKGETFSLTNIEAQLCGLPVLCFPSSGMNETIDNQNSFKALDYTAESFAEVINSINLNSLDRQSIRQFGLKFGLEEMTKKYYQLYKEIKDE